MIKRTKIVKTLHQTGEISISNFNEKRETVYYLFGFIPVYKSVIEIMFLDKIS